jgi:hypothetical protein
MDIILEVIENYIAEFERRRVFRNKMFQLVPNMLNRIAAVQECDARDDDSSNAGC